MTYSHVHVPDHRSRRTRLEVREPLQVLVFIFHPETSRFAYCHARLAPLGAFWLFSVSSSPPRLTGIIDAHYSIQLSVGSEEPNLGPRTSTHPSETPFVFLFIYKVRVMGTESEGLVPSQAEYDAQVALGPEC